VKDVEEILKSINTMVGVSGSFICDSKGRILSVAMPDTIDESMLYNVSKTVSQTLGGLASTHRRKIGELDLVYGQGRLITRNIGESFLCILCVRNINVPLLNLSVNMAVKKLAEMVMDMKGRGIEETEIREKPDSSSQLLITETRSIISKARERGVILQATGDAAIRLHCSRAALMASQLDEQVIQMAGRDKQTTQINQVLSDLGYSRERILGVIPAGRHLRFRHPQKQLNLELFLDVMKMRVQLDFSESLNLYDDTLPLADLVLWKLLHTPFDEQTEKAVYVIISDHELGGPGESEKVDITRIIGLCAGDWEWYKTITDHLEKVIDWADKELGDNAAVFLERARRLLQLIKDAPKSDAWRLKGILDQETSI